MELLERVEVLRQSTFLDGFSYNEISILAILASEVDLCRGDFLFKEGEHPKNIYIIAGGMIKTTIYSVSGKELVLTFCCRAAAVGEVAFLTNKNYASSALALTTRMKVICITKSDFTPYALAHPDLYIKALEKSLQRLVEYQHRLADFAGANAKIRLIKVLIGLCSKFGYYLPFTKYSIADMAGLTPETTIRIMSSLEKQRVICSSRGNVTILDKEALFNNSQ